MGFIGGLLGGGSGAGFQASSANILSPTSIGQANTAYRSGRDALAWQKDFLNQLNAQNGAANLGNVFNQLQGVANGTGPNPAMAALNQATGQNVANQAALMAGQRGAGANAGLLARQIARQGSDIQQQAAGQGALLQAQQQLNALNSMGSVAGQQVGSQQNALSGYNQAAQGLQSNVLGSIANQNNAAVQMQQNMNNANAGIAGGNQQTQSGILGGALGAVGSAFGLAHGGSVPGYAGGGAVSGPQSFAGRYFGGSSAGGSGNAAAMIQGLSSLGQGIGNLIRGNEAPVPAQEMPMQTQPQLSLEEVLTTPEVQLTAPMHPSVMMASDGGKVPGKAKVFGDSEVNDTVPAKLSPGEIVIPRSVLQSDNPALAAAHFVHEELTKQKMACGGSVRGYAAGGMAQEEKAPVVVNVNTDPNQQAMQNNASSMGNSMKSFAGQIPSVSLPNAQSFSNAASRFSNATSSRQPQSVSPEMGQPGPMPASNSPGLVPGSLPSDGLSPRPAAAAPIIPDAASGLKKAFQNQMSGINQEAKALGNLGKAQAGIEQKNIETIQNQYQKYETALSGLEMERKKFQQDIESGRVDPNHFVGSMGTFDKMKTAVGLILGGMGGGILHQENPVLKYLNSQIDRDIESQKMEMGKKENLLSMNMKQFGNLQMAADMTKAMQLSIVDSQLRKAASEAQDPIAKARAMKGIGEIQQQMAPLMQQAATKAALMSNMNSGNMKPEMAARAIDSLVPKEDRDAARKELSAINNYQVSQKEVNNIFDDLKKVSTISAKTPFSKSKADFESKRAVLMGRAGSVLKPLMGNISEGDMRTFLRPFEPSAGDTVDQLSAKQNGLLQTMRMKLNEGTPVLTSNGIKLDTSMNTRTSNEERLLNFAKKNPKSKEGQAILKKLGEK